MLRQTRDLPIGVQSFSDLRESGFVYVDKTQYIKELLTGKYYFLSRPRRFGKSLFLSTLKAYFLGQKELFEGLAMGQLEPELAAQQGREAWAIHPVLYLDLNTGAYKTASELENLLETHLVAWERLYGRDEAEQEHATRFGGVIRRAHEKTGQKVVILVDEYDKPLLNSVTDDTQYEQFRSLLYAFYSNIKSCGESIRFVFLTGVSRFGKLTIFSGLNNLNDISMDTAYAGICGITEEELVADFAPELDALAEEQGHPHDEMLVRLRKRYDGYLFARRGAHVYNPFSLLNVLKKKELGNYWYATGTPTFLVKYLKDRHFFLPELEKDVEMDQEGLQVSPVATDDPIPILFQAGYLTIKEYIAKTDIYRLGFPNEEVKYGFMKNLLTGYSSKNVFNSGAAISAFLRELHSGDVDAFMERLEGIIGGIPYDTMAAEAIKYRERDAQVAAYLVFSLMGQHTETEVHTPVGRVDAVVHTDDIIYVFEFKLSDRGTPEAALAQIDAKGYATRYQKSGKQLVLVGVTFDPEKRNLGAWAVRR